MRVLNIGLLIAAICYLSGCTAMDFPISGLPNDYFKDAESPREVMEMIDNLEDPQCDKAGFMEGYPLADLTDMYDSDRLEITRGSSVLALPAMMGLWVFGAAYVHPGKYGDIYESSIYYLDDDKNFALAHELMHAAGCMEPLGTDFGLLRWTGGYTDEQKEIIEKEGVKHWTDTSHYKLWGNQEAGDDEV